MYDLTRVCIPDLLTQLLGSPSILPAQFTHQELAPPAGAFGAHTSNVVFPEAEAARSSLLPSSLCDVHPQ